MALPQDTTYDAADGVCTGVADDDGVCTSDGGGLIYALMPWLTAALCLLTAASYVAFHYFKSKLRRARALSPIKGVDVVPGAHWLMGHLGLVFDDGGGGHPFLFCENAHPSGISAFWVISKPCASVLKAEHVRAVLRQGSSRDSSIFILRHGRRSLGEESLILVGGGTQWKRQRSIIAKAFTASTTAMMGSRRVVCDVAEDMTRLLVEACAENDVTSGSGSGSLCVEMISFAKSFGMEIFGRVALGHDFDCISAVERSIKIFQRQAREAAADALKGGDDGKGSSYENGGVAWIKMPKEAGAFDYIVNDVSFRLESNNLLKPTVQFYWVPTSHNRRYFEELQIVKEFYKKIIHRQKEAIRKDMESDRNAFEDRKQYRNFLTHLVLGSDDDAGPDELSKIITTNLFGGYETAAISISYVLYCLATNPDVQAKCAEEARRVFRNKRSHRSGSSSSDASSPTSPLYISSSNAPQDAGELVSEENLPYCRAALTESMRVHPTILFTTRMLERPITLDGLELPEGTRTYVPIGNVHSDERNFARAGEYLPERWVRWEEEEGVEGGGRWVDRDHAKEAKERALAADEEEDESYVPAANPHNFFAFSDGARNCVGRRLAIIETTIALATLVRDLTISIDPDFVLEKQRRFVMGPPKCMPIIFHKR